MHTSNFVGRLLQFAALPRSEDQSKLSEFCNISCLGIEHSSVFSGQACLWHSGMFLHVVILYQPKPFVTLWYLLLPFAMSRRNFLLPIGISFAYPTDFLPQA